MKTKIFLLIAIVAFCGCKKEKSDPLSLLTDKPWKPTKSLGHPTNISSFEECELRDSYSFSANTLRITQSTDACIGSRNFSDFSYTIDFNTNIITSTDGMLLYITTLTRDSLRMHVKLAYGTGTIKKQFIFLH